MRLEWFPARNWPGRGGRVENPGGINSRFVTDQDIATTQRVEQTLSPARSDARQPVLRPAENYPSRVNPTRRVTW
jgi:hypothetical protein